MPTLTVIILTKNEAAQIVPAIRNAQKCQGQVLVVDSGSTDGTQQLAEQAGNLATQQMQGGNASGNDNSSIFDLQKERIHTGVARH